VISGQIFSLDFSATAVDSDIRMEKFTEMKKCPFCQKEVKENAVKCRYCGGWFTDDAADKQKEIDKEEQEKKLFKQEKGKAEETLGEHTECFSVSTQKLVIMWILTLGFYELYWFYQNWRSIKIQEEKKLSPFWRAIFSVFYCYTLFKRIIRSANEKGHKGKNTPGTLAMAYIFFVIVTSKAPSPYDFMGILTIVPIYYVNNAVRFNNLSINPQYQERQRLTTGEIWFIIIGILFWLITIADLLSLINPS